jgi:hypothetical protein
VPTVGVFQICRAYDGRTRDDSGIAEGQPKDKKSVDQKRREENFWKRGKLTAVSSEWGERINGELQKGGNSVHCEKSQEADEGTGNHRMPFEENWDGHFGWKIAKGIATNKRVQREADLGSSFNTRILHRTATNLHSQEIIRISTGWPIGLPSLEDFASAMNSAKWDKVRTIQYVLYLRISAAHSRVLEIHCEISRSAHATIQSHANSLPKKQSLSSQLSRTHSLGMVSPFCLSFPTPPLVCYR